MALFKTMRTPDQGRLRACGALQLVFILVVASLQGVVAIPPVPSTVPTIFPTAVAVPTFAPTVYPTAVPTHVPTSMPTPVPTVFSTDEDDDEDDGKKSKSKPQPRKEKSKPKPKAAKKNAYPTNAPTPSPASGPLAAPLAVNKNTQLHKEDQQLGEFSSSDNKSLTAVDSNLLAYYVVGAVAVVCVVAALAVKLRAPSTHQHEPLADSSESAASPRF